MRRSPTLTALAALALAPATVHAAPWTAPQTLSAPHASQGPVGVASLALGGLVAGWRWRDDAGGDASSGAAIATRAPAARGFGAQSPTIDGLVALGPLGLRQTVTVGARAVPTSRGPAGTILRASLGGGPARTLAVARIWGRPVLASAAGGSDALIAYVERTQTASGTRRRVVRAIERRRGTWTAPSTLSGTGRADVLAAAQNPLGDAVVAFVRDGTLVARLRRPGRRWGPIQRLARSSGPTAWTVSTFLDRAGRARVTWRRHPHGGVSELRTAVVPRGRDTFTAPQTLVADGASARFAVASTLTGWVVADVEPTRAGPRPMLHRTPRFAGAPWTRLPVAPAGRGIRGADVAGNLNGSVTVAWVQPVRGQGGDGRIRSATLDADPKATAFGPVEDVSPAEAAHEVRLADDGGLILALWTARPGRAGPDEPRTVVRAAGRTG